MPRGRSLVAIALLGLLAGTASRADEESAFYEEVDEGAPLSPAGPAWPLGSPAHPDAVREAVDRVLPPGEGDARALARALGQAGGRAAAEGLADLLGHPDAAVRVDALAAAGEVGLRAERLAAAARRSVSLGEGDEVLAAIEALGAIGDGRHVDLLLQQASPEVTPTRRRVTAFRALRALTGVNMPYTHHRWAWWWKTEQERAQAELPEALGRLEGAPFTPQVEDARQAVLRLGWHDLPALCERLRTWSIAPDQALRAEACTMAARLRLADLGDAVEGVHAFASTPEVRAAARAAMEALGVRPDPAYGSDAR